MDTPLTDLLPWYFRLNSHIRAPNTRDQYRYAVLDLAEALHREPLASDLTEDCLATLRESLLARQLAVRTINERIGRLVTLWRWLHARGLLATQPQIAKLPQPQRVPVAWTLDQMARILVALTAARGQIDGIPQGLWWRSLLLGLWSTGERITAMLSARWCDLDPVTGWLVIPAERRKGQSADGAYRLTAEARDAVLVIHDPPRDVIWPWPYHRSYLWIRYRHLLRHAGLPTGRYSGFHRIRRTVASYYDLAGGDASRLLGHTDRRTLSAYIDPRISPSPQASDRLPRIG